MLLKRIGKNPSADYAGEAWQTTWQWTDLKSKQLHLIGDSIAQ